MTTVFPLPTHVPVLIAGGGPVGLVTAALLAEYGIESLVIEADPAYCTGSRAICMSRRSLEILGWIGAAAPVVDKGLGWTAGRSYFRDQEVLHFDMPHDPAQRFDPMINIQQYYVEAYAHDAARRQDDLARVAWSSRVVGIEAQADGARVQVESGGQTHTIAADWVIACDGGRSTVRDLLGLALTGMQYEGRYVIVDIEQDSQRPTERLAWFDPPSNPGSTILMHRQPDNVWRIDYQIADDEDADEAVKPENVLPRVQSHLDMIGETAPWKPLWISIYNAKCLTLQSYRHGRVLFAGDAGHLVPIFGVRGLNSGLDDAGNLAWKLAWVMRGGAPEDLLDSFSTERVHATRQNIAYGAKSTEFMAPPSYGFTLMRDAVLRLALADPAVRPLINPRQSAPISYEGSPLNAADSLPAAGPHSAPGEPAPDLRLTRGDEARHLTEWFGRGFVLLALAPTPAEAAALATLCEKAAAPADLSGPALVVAELASHAGCDAKTTASGGHDEANSPDNSQEATRSLHSEAPTDNVWRLDTAAHAPYGGATGAVYVLRPDGYVLGRWPAADTDGVRGALASFHTFAS